MRMCLSLSLAFLLSITQGYGLAETASPNEYGEADIFIDSTNLDGIEASAEHRGWRTERNKNGDLLLFPQPKKVSDNPTDIDVESPSIKSQVQTGNATEAIITSGNLNQLKSTLEQRGWHAEWDENGDLLLFQGRVNTPPSLGVPDPTIQKPSGDPYQAISNGDITIQSTDLDKLENTLKERGWSVSRNADESLILSTKPTPSVTKFESSDFSTCHFDSFPITKGSIVKPPIDQWQEAMEVSKGYLKSKQAKNRIVGKIREINNLYIVSIVQAKAPHKLTEQLVIHKKNGKVISFPQI